MTPPAVEPFDVGSLDVGDGHILYYEQFGRPDGTPVVYLHGGPGAGCTPNQRTSFDAERHRAVLFDQRAAGRSTPHASEEGVHWASIDMGRDRTRVYDDPSFRLGFARQVTHCWRNDSWLSDDEIVVNAHRLAGIPGWLIHGRLDLSSPLDAQWRLHQAWPGSELIIVDDEGHGGISMFTHWRRVLAELA